MAIKRFCLILLLVVPVVGLAQSDLAKRRRDADTRWASFENLAAGKGKGGMENRGAKGHAFDSIHPGETKTLLDVKGAGEIRRMWMTIRERDPQMLRALRLEMFWDGAAKPAVSVPFGDFMGAMLGRPVAFENELFANPEGRSFNCYIPMPFRKGARVTLTNDSTRDLPYLFYDIDFLLTTKPDPEALYFHAIFRREQKTAVGRDFEIVPRVKGEGRFLGANFGVMVNRENPGWWGEGEVKMYVDGDGEFPTIAGTGTEDYIGTGWGQGTYHNRFQGALVGDKAAGQFTFYRYHVPDPVYFHRDLRVTIQTMGGDEKRAISEAMKKGVPLKPVSVDNGGKFAKLLEGAAPIGLDSDAAPGTAWTNVYRSDDWSVVALFYLDAPENGLAAIPGVEERTARMDGPSK
jgi:hypothetical protein